MKDEYLTVAEFAFKTKRPTNQIYDLINKGNSMRKLCAKKINGRWMVCASEVSAYPFNPKTAIAQLKRRLKEQEEK